MPDAPSPPFDPKRGDEVPRPLKTPSQLKRKHKSESSPLSIEDEPGAEERFDRAIKNALAAPPQPHKPTR